MFPFGAPPAEFDSQRHAVLLWAADMVSARREPLEPFREMAARLRAVLSFDFINFALCDPARKIMKMHMWDGATWPLEPVEIPLEESASGLVWRNQTVLSIDDLSAEKTFGPGLRCLRESGIRSYSAVPLTTLHQKLGALGIGSKLPGAFSSGDIQFLQSVAELVALWADHTVSLTAATGQRDRLLARQAGKIQIDFDLSRGLVANALAARDDDTPPADHPVGPAASAALIEWEQLSAVYFSASKVGFCLLDTDLRYLAINDTLADMNGVPAARHLGKSIREVLGDCAELVEPQLNYVLASGQPVLNLEISSMLPQRTEPGHWIAHFIPIKDASGDVRQIGAVVVEITERKKLEESLRGVSKTLKEEKQRQRVLLELGHVLGTKWDAQQIFPKISASLRRVLRQEYAALSLHDEKSGLLVRQAMDFPLGKNLSAGEEISIAKGTGTKVLQERSSLIFSRDEVHEFDPGVAATLNAEGLRSLCCVPLLRPEGPRGVLVLGSTRADAFKTDDLTLLNQVAAQLAMALENARTAREVKELRIRLKREKSYLEGEARTQLHFEEIIGEGAAHKKMLAQVEIVAASDATVLILGETGTGKGLIARAIHRISKRNEQRFIPLNCAAIPTGLLESELFGHEKGAFTGAISQKIGRLELADKGTLFLDEIGEIPLELQPKLLRVLQDHEFERLGGTRTIKVDLRLVAATNRDLGRSVLEKEFRSDLFYRLNVFPIRLPSLRERTEDIPLLVRYFVKRFARRMGRVIETISSETMEALVRWHWPGNVRELENFIERSVILTEGTALRAPLAELQVESSGSPSTEQSLEDAEREHIVRVLRDTRGTISGPRGAARQLGLKRTTLQSKMLRLGISRNHYIDPKTD